MGLKHATTAVIAKTAGVSPGSMYQYFPSKDSLVTAIFQREEANHRRALAALVVDKGPGDVRGLIRAFIEWNVRAIEDRSALYRVLFREVPRVSGLTTTQLIDHQTASEVRLLFELGGDRIRPAHLETAALLVVRAYRYALIPLVDEPLTGEARAAFIDELTDMLAAYLLAPRPWEVHK
jgi:AcrR family transcriptional regulator